MLEDGFDPLRAALAASSILLALVVFVHGVRHRHVVRALAGGTLLALLLWWVYSLAFPATVSTRGDSEGATLVASYVAMVLGMMAHYVYAKAERGETTLSVEWMPFLMPILASPIVFIPLVTIAGEVGTTGGILTRAKLLVYLVAFQNGFFWKHFFDARRSALPGSSSAVR